MTTPQRTCKQCGTTGPEDDFRVTTWMPTGPYRSKTCRKCETANGTSMPDKPRPLPEHHGTPGWVYVVLLPTGQVKIGWSANPVVRWEILGNEYCGRILPLATLPGDSRLETHLHAKFAEFRLPRQGRIHGDGELFHPSPELLAWAMATGIVNSPSQPAAA
jgi:hypothetical protein